MTDELRRRLKESVGMQAEVPVDEIIARGRDHRRRLRQGWVAGSGLVVVAVIAAVVVLSRAPTTQVHVSGGPTPSTAQPIEPPSSSPGSPLPSCQPDQYRLGIGVVGETSAGLGFATRPTLVKGSPCTLTAQAQLSLLDSAGRPLAVTGNPSTAAISGRVGPSVDETMEFPNQFVWSNWCGVRSPEATLQVHLIEQGVSVTRTSSYPICISQGQGSSLTVIPSSESPSPPIPAPNGSPGSDVTQREVAVYSALLRHQVGQLMPTGTATSQSPSRSTFYVLDEFFALAPTATATDPNRFTAITKAGPVSVPAQEGIINALAPIRIVFVPTVEAVEVPMPSAPGCMTVPGSGYVLMLGSIPATGDRIQVYAGWVFPAGTAGHNAVYSLVQSGGSWNVTGTVGPEQSSLGGCG